MCDSKFSIPIFFILIVIFCMCLSSCFSVEEIENENIARVKNIDPSRVKKIEIFIEIYQYQNQKRKLLKVLEIKTEVEGFIHCLKSLRKVRPNHPQYPNKWYANIELENMDNESIMIMQRVGDNRYLYIRCLGHKWFGSAADSVSSELYQWMDKNIGLTKLR